MMPRGPKGEKRPAHVNARAVMIANNATSEIEDVTKDDGKNAPPWHSGEWASRRGPGTQA
jgi:hypothetical protein